VIDAGARPQLKELDCNDHSRAEGNGRSGTGGIREYRRRSVFEPQLIEEKRDQPPPAMDGASSPTSIP
jgi:hypothetical protein